MNTEHEAVRSQTDDMILAPDMMIAVYNDRQMVEALIYQDTYIFTAVCTDDGCLVASLERRSL